jgi:ribosome-associated toxin RatA of RatAB toxin-antitoxin module
MKFRQSVDIAAEPQALFDLTQDYSRRLDWDPFLEEARLVGAADRAGVGARAWCVAHNGIGMETRYVSFERPRVCAVELTRGPWPIRSFAGSWRFDRLEPGRSRVTFTYSLVGRPRFLTRLIGLVFARETRRRLAALKMAAESGPRPPEASCTSSA